MTKTEIEKRIAVLYVQKLSDPYTDEDAINFEMNQLIEQLEKLREEVSGV